MSGAVAKRVNETGKALGGTIAYAWSTLAVFARWQNAQVTVTVDGEEGAADVRRHRRQRALPGRRHEDLPRRGARRRPLRRALDRRRDQASS